jgi:hypothetical protein
LNTLSHPHTSDLVHLLTQIHEPCLTTSQADDLITTATTTYEILATGGASIHLVIPYDDVSDVVYRCVVQLPVSAIGFDFCGVPGATSGNTMCELIAKYGFPQVRR